MPSFAPHLGLGLSSSVSAYSRPGQLTVADAQMTDAEYFDDMVDM